MADQALSDEARVNAIVVELGGGELLTALAPVIWRKYAALAALPYQRELNVKITLLTTLLAQPNTPPAAPTDRDRALLLQEMQERGINLRALLRHYTEMLAGLGGGGDGTTGTPLEPLSGVIARDTPIPAAPGAPDPWDGYLGRDGRGTRTWGWPR